MPRSTLLTLAALTAAVASQAAHADIVNASFEMSIPGDPYTPLGWENYPNPEYGFLAGRYWGDYVYGRGAAEGEWVGFVTGLGVMSQVITLAAGDQVLIETTGYSDVSQYSMSAVVVLDMLADDVSASASLWLGDSSNPRGFVPAWRTLSVTAPEDGTYTLALFTRGMFTGDGEFMVFYDNLRVVPAPGAATVLAMCGVLAARRRR